MSLGGKYVFATVMYLVLPMCILISCSSVLCVLMALGMFMFVKDTSLGTSYRPISLLCPAVKGLESQLLHCLHAETDITVQAGLLC